MEQGFARGMDGLDGELSVMHIAMPEVADVRLPRLLRRLQHCMSRIAIFPFPPKTYSCLTFTENHRKARSKACELPTTFATDFR